MKTFKTVILLIFAMSLFACSDENNEAPKKETSGDHVWKSQTDTIQKAKDATKKLQDSLNQQQQKTDETN